MGHKVHKGAARIVLQPGNGHRVRLEQPFRVLLIQPLPGGIPPDCLRQRSRQAAQVLILPEPGPGLLPGIRQGAFLQQARQLIQRRHRGQGRGLPYAAQGAPLLHQLREKPADVCQLAQGRQGLALLI